MKRFIARRLLTMLPTFLGITLVTSTLALMAPGEPYFGESSLETVHAQTSASRSFADAFSKYLTWTAHFARLDFGRSVIDQQLVIDKVFRALPVTLLITSASLVVSWLVAVPLGVYLARRARTKFARVIDALVMGLWSLPSFWVAISLLLLFANPRALNWFPFQGLKSPEGGGSFVDVAWHLVLPVVTMSVPLIAMTTRHVRVAVEQALLSDWVRGAEARGLPARVVVLNYAVRSALVSLLAVLAIQLPHLVGGSVVIETMFGIPGMGLLSTDAFQQRDYPTTMAIAALCALMIVVSVALVDIVSAVLDRRILTQGRS